MVMHQSLDALLSASQMRLKSKDGKDGKDGKDDICMHPAGSTHAAGLHMDQISMF